MVQGGLLIAHSGSVHGDGEAPGGGSYLRQGAGTGSPGSPDLETAAVENQRRVLEKGFCPKGFCKCIKCPPFEVLEFDEKTVGLMCLLSIHRGIVPDEVFNHKCRPLKM